MTNFRKLRNGPSIVLLTMLSIVAAVATSRAHQHKAKAPRSMRLYVFDCGVIHMPTN